MPWEQPKKWQKVQKKKRNFSSLQEMGLCMFIFFFILKVISSTCVIHSFIHKFLIRLQLKLEFSFAKQIPAHFVNTCHVTDNQISSFALLGQVILVQRQPPKDSVMPIPTILAFRYFTLPFNHLLTHMPAAVISILGRKCRSALCTQRLCILAFSQPARDQKIKTLEFPSWRSG